MSIFQKLFGNAPVPQQQQQQQQTQPGNMPVNAGTTAPNNVTVPAQSAEVIAKADENKSPLDGFSELWQAPAKVEGETPPGNMFNIDPQKLLELAQKNNFAKSVTPELLAKISAGGDEAQAALLQALNQTSSNTFALSTQTNAKIVETALAKQREEFAAMLPGLIKQQTVSESLKAENPIFKHPAAAPMLDALQAQLAVKHPSATGKELETMSKDFLLALAESANPNKKVEAAAGAKKEQDWSAFLE